MQLLFEPASPDSKTDSINKYKEVILEECPDISNFEVLLPRRGLNLLPWDSWLNDEVPTWWTANNKFKHHRGSQFNKANLFNTLNSVAALYIVNLYLYRDKAESGELIPMQALFRPGVEHFNDSTFNGVEFGINYKL